MTVTADVETFQGRQAEIAVSTWPNPETRRIVTLAHVYGQYLGRYDHVAEALVGRGAIVAGPDHVGHGRSGGERVIVTDFDEIPDDPLDVSPLSRDPSVGETYRADELVWHGPFERATLQALDRALHTINEGPKLGALPTLWIHGEDDQLVPIGETRAGIETLGFPALEEGVYPRARHHGFNETNKDEGLAKTADFVERVTG